MPAFCRTRQRSSSLFVSIPSTHMVPSEGMSSAFMCLASVDFPDPLWPRIATKVPVSISRSMPRSTSGSRTSRASVNMRRVRMAFPLS